MAIITKIEENKAVIGKKKVAAYCRVSTDQDDQLLSLETQKAHYESWIQGHSDWEYAGLYYDEGLSGTKMDTRPSLLRMMEDCKHGLIDYVVTKSVSRLARNTADFLTIVRTLLDLGIPIYFEKENIDTGSMENELMLSIMSSIAESESVSISENNKWSIQRKFKNGTYKCSYPPYGYDWDKKNGEMVVNPEQAEIVRYIFAQTLAGVGTHDIAKDLMVKGVPRVAAYCRVSTDSDEQATSYEMQVEHYTEYISKNPGWELAGIYADDGISGTNTKKREDFNRMIEDCMAGKIDFVISKSISRFARNTLDCLQYIRQLKDKGIAVFFEKENINTMDTKGELLLTIMASLAQQESESLSQNVKLGLQFRYQAGKVQVNHNRFLGYTKDDDGNLIIEPTEAAVIKRIYREYLEGASYRDICNGLMADGILTGASKKKWIPSTIHKILSNEKYIGDALLQKTITTNLLEKKREINNGLAPQYYVEDSHEAIIPRDLFMRVQEEMVRRANLRSGEDGKKKRIYSSKYALSSLCTCEKCGDIYRRIAWNNRGKKYTVWRCCTRVEHGPGECNAPTIQETDLQAAVMKAINKVVGQKSTVIANLETILEQTVVCADEELAELDEKIKAVQLELVDRATSSEGYEDLARESDRLNEEKQKILVTLAEDKGRQEKKAELIDFLHEQTTEFEEFDDGLVRRLIEQITVHENGTFTVEFKSGTMVEV